MNFKINNPGSIPYVTLALPFTMNMHIASNENEIYSYL